MLNIDPTLLLLLVACLFVLVFGGLGLTRREGLSVQLAVEVVILTALLVGGSWLLGIQLNPFLFLILLYLVTMRSRLAVDLANLVVRRGNQNLAFRLYDLALAMWPDAASRLIVLSNRGIALLYTGKVDEAIALLQSVLASKEGSGLGLKYEAACHYNLGFAHEQKGEDSAAVAHYNETIDVFPGSVYAQGAQAALRRRKKQDSPE